MGTLLFIDPTETSTKMIEHEIEMLQNIQKTNPQNSVAWKHAHRQLKPRFAEMAREKHESTKCHQAKTGGN